MQKLVHVIVDTHCLGCPFVRYDGDYGMSYDSGYNCEHPDAKQYRIADDGDISAHRNKWMAYNKSLNTLFPIPKPEGDNPMAIPSWCPLPNG